MKVANILDRKGEGVVTVDIAFTLQSALDVWRGRGGMWKGRAQAQMAQEKPAQSASAQP